MTNDNMTNDNLTDDELYERLRRVVDERDPPPEALAAAARDAFGLGRLGNELAALVADSALQTSSARGADDVRMLSFQAEDLELTVQLRGESGSLDVAGMVTETVDRLTLETPEGEVELTVDGYGRFRQGGLRGSMLRLVVRRPSGRTATTAWVLVG